MVVIHVHVGKNIVEDVLLDGGLGVNISIKDLRKKLGLHISILAPYTFRMVNQTLTKPIGCLNNHNIMYLLIIYYYDMIFSLIICLNNHYEFVQQGITLLKFNHNFILFPHN
jgi:hypothetical protein